MCANFMCTSLPACEITRERRNSLLAVIDMTEKEDLIAWEESYDEDIEECRNRLRLQINEYSGFREDREVGEWAPKGSPYKVFFTGGMSFGDMPTEAYQVFDDLSNHPVIYKLLEVYASTDYVRPHGDKNRTDIDTLQKIDNGEELP